MELPALQFDFVTKYCILTHGHIPDFLSHCKTKFVPSNVLLSLEKKENCFVWNLDLVIHGHHILIQSSNLILFKSGINFNA